MRCVFLSDLVFMSVTGIVLSILIIIMAVDNKGLVFDEIRRIGKLSNDGVFIYSIGEERLLYANDAFVKIVELDRNLVMDEPKMVAHYLPQADTEYLSKRYSDILKKGSVEDVQVRLIQNNSEKILSCNAYLGSNNGNIIGFVKDISRLRQNEDYLINFGARKDAILDMVSQNLTTPLNLSRFTLDLIEKAVQEKKYNKLDAHIKIMREVTSDCIRIIDKFLQEEHLEAPNIKAKVNRFDAVAKVRIVSEKLKEANPDKQFRITAETRHVFINADATKFFQIVHNILSNAVKFTKPEGLIEVTVREEKSKVQVTVQDDGVGIPDDIKPYVFDKKTRAARPGLKGEISNGIGLFVVNQLVQQLNGSISFDSKENQGTRFIVELPRDAPF